MRASSEELIHPDVPDGNEISSRKEHASLQMHSLDTFISEHPYYWEHQYIVNGDRMEEDIRILLINVPRGIVFTCVEFPGLQTGPSTPLQSKSKYNDLDAQPYRVDRPHLHNVLCGNRDVWNFSRQAAYNVKLVSY